MLPLQLSTILPAIPREEQSSDQLASMHTVLLDSTWQGIVLTHRGSFFPPNQIHCPVEQCRQDLYLACSSRQKSGQRSLKFSTWSVENPTHARRTTRTHQTTRRTHRPSLSTSTTTPFNSSTIVAVGLLQ